MKRAKKQVSLAITLLVSFVLILGALVPPATGVALRARAHAPSLATPQSGDLVPNQYVIVFKEDFAGDVVAAANELVNANGGTLLHTYQYALKGFSAIFTGGVAALQSDSRVASIEQDRVVSISGSRKQIFPPTWGLDRIDQRDLPLNNSYIYEAAGAGVRIYIIDTGIRITHLDFDGRASYGYDFVDDDPIADDGHGHGTHVAGTAGGKNFGVAKSAKLIAVRVLDNFGNGTFEGVIAGVDYVTGQRQSNPTIPAVANMSLGAQNFSFPPLENAIRFSILQGVTYAIAAGNGSDINDACDNTPSNVTEALIVGATKINDVRAIFSSVGPCLDLFAPGENINSAWITNDSASMVLSGTSMATPHVAGVAALYLGRHPFALPPEVMAAIINNSTPNRVIDPGPGSPNRLLFSRFQPMRTPFDFNANGTADESVARPYQNTNYLWYSPTFSDTNWGNLTDVLVPADYDGDARTDIAVWRPSDGVWYIIPSTTNVPIYPQWGTNGDIPVPGDYDGDFRDDLAVFRPSNGTWYILNSNNGQTQYRYWGFSGDRPVPADYDGDGLTDAALIRPNTNHTWYILNSSNGQPSYVQWGLDTDIDVPGDYDGDGKTDQAVRRTSENIWYIRLSTTGQLSTYNWGLSSDIAVPADYDGDGRTDIAVWRPSNGTWYIVLSSTGQPDYRNFGLNGDVPLPTATPRG